MDRKDTTTTDVVAEDGALRLHVAMRDNVVQTILLENLTPQTTVVEIDRERAIYLPHDNRPEALLAIRDLFQAAFDKATETG